MWPKRRQILFWLMITSAALSRQWCGAGMYTTASPSFFSSSWLSTLWPSLWLSPAPASPRSEICVSWKVYRYQIECRFMNTFKLLKVKLFYLNIFLFRLIFCWISPGFPSEGCTDVVGELDHGYFCISGLGNRATYRVSTEEEAIRSQ